VAIAVSFTVVLTLITTLCEFGADQNATVLVGLVEKSGIIIGAVISALLTGVLTYRSGLVMQELNLARAELLRLSRTDPLTGLLNRRGFDEMAALVLLKANATKLSVVALMCDIDRFKAVNDQFGHEFGDRVLVEVATILGAFAREHGVVVARHGGEEFAVLMTGFPAQHAMEIANRFRRACSAHEINFDGVSTNVTISIGMTLSHAPTDLQQIMRTADQALYSAKHRGRDRVARTEITASIAA
jgi:diguanylate cyclase (GGDEF)-like protein